MAGEQEAGVFDYVIVGSGAAGSVLANRLTEDPGVTVCVLEAGPPDRHPYIHIPAGFIKMLFNPGFTWQFKTEPAEDTGGRRDPDDAGPHAGRLQLDQRHDLQSRPARRFRQLGAARQSRLGLCRRAALFQAHRAAHRRSRDDRIHGREGNMPVTDMDWIHPLCEAFIAGAIGLGHPAQPGLQQRRRRRASAISSARSIAAGGIQRGARLPASGDGAAAIWRCAPMRAPPRSCSRASARSACAMSTTATGRPAARGARAARGDPVRAAPPTPRSCCRSPASVRRRCWHELGVPVVHDLRGVGENFRDHYAARLVARVKNSHDDQRAGARRPARRRRSPAGRWAGPASWR